uniref:Ldh family oxidoreductase n=1 Tax=Staphylothermus marinus TaxID=2280 RepID=A0A7J3PJY2_STAMA
MKYFEKEVATPPENYVRVDHVSLREFVREIFIKTGVKPEYSSIVADVLVTADLMGISSHGVRSIRRYVEGIRSKSIEPNNEPVVVSDIGAITLIDGMNGLGQVISIKALDYLFEKIKYYGIGLVGVRRSNHFGPAGYYSLKIVEKGFIGISMSNSRPLVAYINTVEKNIGTNPLAIGLPRRKPPPILYDAATSIVPIGRIEYYSIIGREIPLGWVVDSKGEYLSGNPVEILNKIVKGDASLIPLGGLSEETGGHKGSGLALIIDILSGVLTGANWGKNVGYSVRDKPANVGHLFIGIDIDCFMDREVFYDRLEKYIEELKSSRKRNGCDNIWIPGEKSWYTMMTRLEIGIPLHKNVYNELLSIGRELGVKTNLVIK